MLNLKTINLAFLPPEHQFSQLHQNTAVEIISSPSARRSVLVRSVIALYADVESTTEVMLAELKR